MIYLVARQDSIGYDEYDSFVVGATSEEEARAHAKDYWGNTPFTCTDVTESKGIILDSYNAG